MGGVLSILLLLPLRARAIFECRNTRNSRDYFFMLFGTLGAAVTGLSIPSFQVVFGEMMDSLNRDGASFQDQVNFVATIMGILAAVNLVSGIIQVYFWSYTGERQSHQFREACVRSILRQDIAWFDSRRAVELSTKVADQCATVVSRHLLNIGVIFLQIQEGMGRKFGDLLQYSFQVVGSFIVALYLSWKLALVLMVCVPAIGVAAAMLIVAVTDATKNSLAQYAAAGGLATESIDAIRTVTALNMQPAIITKYREFLLSAMDVGIVKGIKVGLSNGLLFGCCFLTYALGFWYGATLVADDMSNGCTKNCYTGGEVLAAFFCVLMGSIAMGQIGPSLNAVSAAISSASEIFEVIERTPEIDGLTEEGLVLVKPLSGSIELKDVEFSYPSRPENVICRNYNLSIQPGELVALCGPSGCGKSTVVNLVLRFYDANQGQVLLDGTDIKQFNTRWLRSQIGYVGQEPVLFAGSVFDNIAYGLNLSAADVEKDKATIMDRVISAAQQANAHEFISSFPQGYETDVGSNGLSLSGGQKQRIAIARALVKRPAILLLDEATSALDAESERYVQESIDKLQQSKAQTTLVIAHRLSTIRNADKIAVISGGKVAELGNHEALMSSKGLYADLVAMQLELAEKEVDMTDFVPVDSIVEETQVALDGEAVETSVAIGDCSEKDYSVVSRIWAILWQQAPYVIIGIIGAVMYGAMFPLWGYVLAQAQDIFYEPTPELVREGGVRIAIYFVCLAIGSIAASVLLCWGMGIAYEHVSATLRSDLFESIMHRQIEFFDRPENTSGSLTTMLADDARIANKATGEVAAKQIQALVTLVVGIIIGFTASWKISLIVISTFPLTIVAGAIQSEGIAQRDFANNGNLFNGILGAAFAHMRTVSAFSMQEQVQARYNMATKLLSKDRRKKGLVEGFGYGASNTVIFGSYGLVFWYGAKLMIRGEIEFVQLMTAIMTLMIGAIGLGVALAGLGDQKDSLEAAKRIFDRIDAAKEDVIDGLSSTGTVPSAPLSGKIEFKNVSFSYPSRKNIKVCKDNTFTIQPGETVAFVGPSGSGKSTVMNLLLRFYDADEGDILLDGYPIKNLNVRWLRSQIGYVGQEPVLFAGTIADNVMNGKYMATNPTDTVVPTYEEVMRSRAAQSSCCSADVAAPNNKGYSSPAAVTDMNQIESAVAVCDVEMGNLNNSSIDPEVVRACELSHAAEFINTFPNGYLTDVGESSAMISGGQKQRIAIARSLVKHPSILLLDEATSALDASAERLVQESINSLQASRAHTTLVIAHRLSTIRNADKIVVVKKGEIVETGKHDDLLQLNGVYAHLWHQQCRTDIV